jgi:ubiquinone/menaquinone biosynthesis C-methylase UbiE
MKAQENKYIFTDETDYSVDSIKSIWGTEEQPTINCLNNSIKGGVWLNLCAGDGRFNNILVKKADKVIATDIDINPLKKLRRNTSTSLKNKLETQTMDVVDTFPFLDNKFDGVFCTGTLHLFPEKVLRKIAIQIDRVLKVGGQLIIDFATDIKRVQPDGTYWIIKNEPSYTKDLGEKLLRDIFSSYNDKITFGISGPEKVDLGDRKYTFSSNYILLKAKKIK